MGEVREGVPNFFRVWGRNFVSGRREICKNRVGVGRGNFLKYFFKKL